MDLQTLWEGLGWPLLRLSFFISLGLLIGNLIEALNWTRGMARLASPLVRLGHLKDISGASFSMAFFSGVTANTMLAEAYDKGRLTKKELIFSNLFNSMPTFFLHLPTTFFIMAPLIKWAAVPYLVITSCSALLRVFIVLGLSRLMLPWNKDDCVVCELPDSDGLSLKLVLTRTWERYKQRIHRILYFTVPIYTVVFFMSRFGVFGMIEGWMADHVGFLSWMPPEALGIVAMQVAAEFSAGLATAGALLDENILAVNEVVVALLVGNILSSPMRMFRHQFPYYAGIFKPGLALNLIIYNQSLRVGSVILVTAAYLAFLA